MPVSLTGHYSKKQTASAPKLHALPSVVSSVAPDPVHGAENTEVMQGYPFWPYTKKLFKMISIDRIISEEI